MWYKYYLSNFISGAGLNVVAVPRVTDVQGQRFLQVRSLPFYNYFSYCNETQQK